MQVIAEKEPYLLVFDGTRFTVVERRAGEILSALQWYPARS